MGQVRQPRANRLLVLATSLKVELYPCRASRDLLKGAMRAARQSRFRRILGWKPPSPAEDRVEPGATNQGNPGFIKTNQFVH